MKKNDILIVRSELLNDIMLTNKSLITKRNEYSGLFSFGNRQCNKRNCFQVAFGPKTNTGNKCFTDIPPGKISFHTHPVACYKSEQVLWGWPSGPDMGAVIKLKDNKHHIVFALEGIYIVSVKPLVKKNISASDIKKIIDVFSITHEFRLPGMINSFKNTFNQLKTKSTDHPVELWLNLANNYRANINGSLQKIFNVEFIPNASFQYTESEDDAMKILNRLNSKNINNYVRFIEDIQLN